MSAVPIIQTKGRVLVADGVVYVRELEEHDDEVARIVAEADDPVAAASSCLRIGARWVHLRLCLQCGHVGCCDQSPNKHATAHYHAEHHPLIQSFEPGEDWLWCYVDEVMMEPT